MKRSPSRFGTAAIMLCLVLGACSHEQAPPPHPLVPVTVVKSVTRDMPVVANAVGTVEAINSISVKSLVDGELQRAFVVDGVNVKAGQPLFRIDSRPAEAALRQAEATQAKGQATLGQARSQVKRYEDLAGKGYISADQMEQYRTNLDSATASVKVDQANVAAAKVTLGYTKIDAPISGRLGRILIQPGNVVKANDTNPLVVINQIEPIYVSFALPASLLGRVLTAQHAAPLAVHVTVEGIAQPIEGKVAFVDNAVDSSTGTIKLRGEFANTEHLLWPGQLVTVRLIIAHDPNAVVLPERAVQSGQDGTYVYAVKPDLRAEQRGIKVARIIDGSAVIETGLVAGETVVLDGQSRVKDGAALKVVEATP